MKLVGQSNLAMFINIGLHFHKSFNLVIVMIITVGVGGTGNNSFRKDWEWGEKKVPCTPLMCSLNISEWCHLLVKNSTA